MSCLRSAAELLASTKLIPETRKDRALEIAREPDRRVLRENGEAENQTASESVVPSL
jgi:hypothetical protein